MKPLHLLPFLIAACCMAPRAHALPMAAPHRPAPPAAPHPDPYRPLLAGLAVMVLTTRSPRNEAFALQP